MLAWCAILFAQAPAVATPPAGDGFFPAGRRGYGHAEPQPHWATPLATVTSQLEQELRVDFVRQTEVSNGTQPRTYDDGKGLELIPFRSVKLLINAPPYIQHNTTSKDGRGDVSFTMNIPLWRIKRIVIVGFKGVPVEKIAH